MADGRGRDPKSDDERPSEPLTTTDIRERAVAGVAVDLVRGFGVRTLSLAGTLVLARLLTPYDFGLVAIGSTFIAFSTFLADGGIGAGLIRRIEAPTRDELRALLAFQVGLSTILMCAISAIAIPFGEVGGVTALMVTTLPLIAIRVPGVILLERQLAYKPLALVDLVETVVYVTLAIGPFLPASAYGASRSQRSFARPRGQCCFCASPLRHV